MDSLTVADARKIPLPDECVQCVVTSPPYYRQRDYGSLRQIGVERTPSDYINAIVDVFCELRRVLRDDGTVWLNLGDTYADNSLIGIPWRVSIALSDDGWNLRCDVIWNKPNAMPESVKNRPTRSHEYLFLLSKSKHYKYDKGAIAEAAVNGDGNRPRGSMGARSMNSGRRESVEERERVTTRNRRSVWNISTEHSGVQHYATMPKALARLCIMASTEPGDLVLDPFAGSGTTLRVAKELGRDALGFDINPMYIGIAASRLLRWRA